jgi:hypothetical protein
MSELTFILLFFGIPGIFGFIMARRLKKNPFIWGMICAIFPFFLLVLTIQDNTIIQYIINNKQKIIGTILLMVGTIGGVFVLNRKNTVLSPFGEIFNFPLAHENLYLLIISGVVLVSGIILLGLSVFRNK